MWRKAGLTSLNSRPLLSYRVLWTWVRQKANGRAWGLTWWYYFWAFAVTCPLQHHCAPEYLSGKGQHRTKCDKHDTIHWSAPNSTTSPWSPPNNDFSKSVCLRHSVSGNPTVVSNAHFLDQKRTLASAHRLSLVQVSRRQSSMTNSALWVRQ